MTKERLEELLNECINYICEVVNDEEEAQDVFRHLGFTSEEAEYFDIIISVLPDEVKISLAELDYDESTDNLETKILDYLSDVYGFCINSFNFDINEENEVCAYDIDWDTTD